MPRRGFGGFPPGKLVTVRVPELFFTELLPQIDNLPELKLTLYVLWLATRRRDRPPYVTFEELASDGALLESLDAEGTPPIEVLRQALERAVNRGTLLKARVVKETDGGENRQAREVYFLNSERGRRALRLAQEGKLKLEGVPEGPVTLEQVRPNIFTLYEQNIGLISPLIAEELIEAERSYPPEWIEEAFKLAVERNIRNWRYIKRILERWATEGKDDGKAKRGPEEDRYSILRSKYARYFRR